MRPGIIAHVVAVAVRTLPVGHQQPALRGHGQPDDAPVDLEGAASGERVVERSHRTIRGSDVDRVAVGRGDHATDHRRKLRLVRQMPVLVQEQRIAVGRRQDRVCVRPGGHDDLGTAGLLRQSPSGRHIYYRLGNYELAAALESFEFGAAQVATPEKKNAPKCRAKSTMCGSI